MQCGVESPPRCKASAPENPTERKNLAAVALRRINPHRPLELKSREIRRPGGFQGHMFQPDTLCLTFAETLSLALCVFVLRCFPPVRNPHKNNRLGARLTALSLSPGTVQLASELPYSQGGTKRCPRRATLPHARFSKTFDFSEHALGRKNRNQEPGPALPESGAGP